MRTWAKVTLGTVAAVAAWETGWWLRRRINRTTVYNKALARSRALGRPLVVVGAPDRGATGGYPCGDITVDIGPSTCPRAIQADITKPLPFEDGSVVVFVSCVLEYVADLPAALRELCRATGGEVFITRVEPWTIASFCYPGARNRLASAQVLTPCAGG